LAGGGLEGKEARRTRMLPKAVKAAAAAASLKMVKGNKPSNGEEIGHIKARDVRHLMLMVHYPCLQEDGYEVEQEGHKKTPGMDKPVPPSILLFLIVPSNRTSQTGPLEL